MLSFRIETITPSADEEEVKTDALARLLELSQPQDPRLRPEWVPQLPALYNAAGLEVVEVDVRNAPLYLALAMHECNLTIHELIARQSNNQSMLEAVRDLMPQVVAETRQGACWAFTRWTVVGRKKTAPAGNN